MLQIYTGLWNYKWLKTHEDSTWLRAATMRWCAHRRSCQGHSGAEEQSLWVAVYQQLPVRIPRFGAETSKLKVFLGHFLGRVDYFKCKRAVAVCIPKGKQWTRLDLKKVQISKKSMLLHFWKGLDHQTHVQYFFWTYIDKMGFSWNRGTPSYHPSNERWDFPWTKPTSDKGVPPWLWKHP